MALLGLDTGGTYTDAVLLDDAQHVLATAKALTTHSRLIDGLRAALDQVLDRMPDQVPDQAPKGKQHGIRLVSLSTTLATNALVEGQGRAVGLVLIGYSQRQFQRARLREALGTDPVLFIAGGHDAGGAELAPPDLAALSASLDALAPRVDAWAVSAQFSVRNPAHEQAVAALLRAHNGKPVSCGYLLSGSLDAPRRALTTLLNARLIPLIDELLQAMRALLSERAIDAPLMIVKGDGSLISGAMARESPVETILSGPAASVVGARFLCETPELLIADMGGTTTDLARLHDGEPLLDADGATVGGWRTMVQAIDVQTIGLGGDSAVRYDRERRDISLGPDRVMPLCRFIHQYPDSLAELHAQRDADRIGTHAGQFVLATGRPVPALSTQQRELMQAIQAQPRSLDRLFADQTLSRALERLVARGLVMRAGFTPTDASHLLGTQSQWSADGAHAGACVLMRYSADNLGRVYGDVDAFARAVSTRVAHEAALAVTDTALQSVRVFGRRRQGLTASQRELLGSCFGVDSEPGRAVAARLPIRLQVQLDMPLMALGAPAETYYPQVARMLATQMILPNHADVANALGAVVGSVRQSVRYTLTPAGGQQVTLHHEAGPETFDSLEAAAAAAEARATEQATRQARAAGAEAISVRCTRHDNLVEEAGAPVFFGSEIVAIATGRPGLGR